MGNAVQVAGPLGTSIRGKKGRGVRREGGRSLDRDEEERRSLEEAGWEPDDGEGGAIWRHPEDGNRYEQARAVQLLKGGEDVGSSD